MNGWNNVVKDIKLEFADFLLFRVVDQSTYSLLVYSPNGCEKVLAQKDEVDEDVGGEVEDIVDEDEEIDDGEEKEYKYGYGPDYDYVEEHGVDDDSDDDDHDNVKNDYDDNVKNEYDDDDYEDDKKNEGNDPFFRTIITSAHKKLLVRSMIIHTLLLMNMKKSFGLAYFTGLENGLCLGCLV